MSFPDTRYATTSDGAYIAFQAVGDGPVDFVWQFDWVGNVDLIWQHSIAAPWLRGLSSFSRVILHDRRGTGLSSRTSSPQISRLKNSTDLRTSCDRRRHTKTLVRPSLVPR